MLSLWLTSGKRKICLLWCHKGWRYLNDTSQRLVTTPPSRASAPPSCAALFVAPFKASGRSKDEWEVKKLKQLFLGAGRFKQRAKNLFSGNLVGHFLKIKSWRLFYLSWRLKKTFYLSHNDPLGPPHHLSALFIIYAFMPLTIPVKCDNIVLDRWKNSTLHTQLIYASAMWIYLVVLSIFWLCLCVTQAILGENKKVRIVTFPNCRLYCPTTGCIVQPSAVLCVWQ